MYVYISKRVSISCPNTHAFPFVLSLCAVLCVRQKFFSVLQPQQAHARALRRATLQMRLLQQGKVGKKETLWISTLFHGVFNASVCSLCTLTC